MRKILLLLLAAVLLTSVSSPRVEPLTDYVPIMMDRSQLNTSVAAQSVKPMKKTGKLYKFNSSLFVVEPYKGIHVFDNANPAQPVAQGFIRIPGCIDMAIKDNYLYADNAVDLVTLDISDASNIRVVDRAENVFPESLPPDKLNMPIAFSKEKRPEGLIIVGWELKNKEN